MSVDWFSGADSVATSFPGSYTPGFLYEDLLKIECSYHPLPANVGELRTRIIAAVAKVTPEMLRSVWQEIMAVQNTVHIL
jgi:hypothetical protein